MRFPLAKPLLALAALALNPGCTQTPPPKSNLPAEPVAAAAVVEDPPVDAGPPARTLSEAWLQAKVGDAQVFSLGDLHVPGGDIPLRVRLEVVQVALPSVWVALSFLSENGAPLPAPELWHSYLARMEVKAGVEETFSWLGSGDLAAIPEQHAGDVAFRVVEFDGFRSEASHIHYTRVVPRGAAYLAEASLDVQGYSKTLEDARLVDVVHGRGGPGQLPIGAIELSPDDTRYQVEHDEGDGRRPAGALLSREVWLVGLNGEYAPNDDLGPRAVGSLLIVARRIRDSAAFRLTPHEHGLAKVRGHDIATLEVVVPNGKDAFPEPPGRLVYAANPFDPLLEGAPYPFRFEPLYKEYIDSALPAAVNVRYVVQYSDWTSAK